jgi:hypothetical protein
MGLESDQGSRIANWTVKPRAPLFSGLLASVESGLTICSFSVSSGKSRNGNRVSGKSSIVVPLRMSGSGISQKTDLHHEFGPISLSGCCELIVKSAKRLENYPGFRHLFQGRSVPLLFSARSALFVRTHHLGFSRIRR